MTKFYIPEFGTIHMSLHIFHCVTELYFTDIFMQILFFKSFLQVQIQ